nr:sugar transferase [Ruminococcus sp.]
MNKDYLATKRGFDIFCSLLGLIGTFPLFIVAIIGIELSDPGPVFYMANRIGKGNKPFKMYKFRSMRQGKANESVFRGDEDRIFPFGKFMRAAKIDELPQLVNILKGDMSIVGPRPAAVDQMQITRGGKYKAAGKVPSGLTGPSALYDYIYGDDIEEAEDYEKLVLPTRLELDLYYLKKMSFGFDLKMIVWTVIAVIGVISGHKPKWMMKKLCKAVGKEVPKDS